MTNQSGTGEFATIIGDVASYYGQRIAEHGTTARGVDWNGVESQTLRFVQLARVINSDRPFSITDVGCGYGAFFDFLTERFERFSYTGTDISAEMIAAARDRLKPFPNAEFVNGTNDDRQADYSIASGIFNVRLGHNDEAWKNYMVATLDVMADHSREGFAFNCLTSYSDADRMQKHLYYANPGAVFDLCKRRYSRQVALLHDYGLYEFTMIVRKGG